MFSHVVAPLAEHMRDSLGFHSLGVVNDSACDATGARLFVACAIAVILVTHGISLLWREGMPPLPSAVACV
jgi:hypothetical protein